MVMADFPLQRHLGDIEVAVPLASEFRFAHEPVTPETAVRFVGREAEISALLERILFSEGGSFLVTGYRGVGKTSFVNMVIQRLEEALPWVEPVLGPTRLLDVHLTVARALSPAELMHLIIRRLYQRLAELGILRQLPRELRDALILAYNRTSMNLTRSLTESSETAIGLNEGAASLASIPALLPFSWLSFNRRRSSSHGTGMAYLAYDDRSAEHDIIHLSRQLAHGYVAPASFAERLMHAVSGTPEPRVRLKIVFVFDELDKLDDPLSDGTVRPGQVLDELLSTLKTLFTTSGICFIFVAGKDLQERWVSDLQRGDSIYESVFAHDLYIPCLWSQEVDIGGQHVVWSDLPDALPAAIAPFDPAAAAGVPPPGPAAATPCPVCAVPGAPGAARCPNCGVRRVDAGEAREVFKAFTKYLRYKGRGIPRRALREFNAYVRWYADRPLLCFTPLDRRKFIAYGQLYDAIMSRQKQLFGALAEETRGTYEDRRRLGIFYLCDWILRQGISEFTLSSAIASSRQLSAKIAFAEDLAPGVVKELIETLVRHEFVEQRAASHQTAMIAGVNDGEARYHVSHRRLIEMGLLKELLEPEERMARPGADGRARPGDRRYEVVRVIGQGGMGQVELAWDPVRGRQVAIKSMHAFLASDPNIRLRFKREAEIMLRLSHPNIVRCYEADLDGERPSIVMDYIEGSTLRKVLDETGSLSPERAIAIMRPVLDALDYLHRQGFVRNDIKPSNIMIQTSGQIVLTDFGITKGIDEGLHEITDVNMMVGTPAYMAPEQISSGAVDARTDIYAVGAVLYEMLSGSPPFTAPTTTLLLHKISLESPPPLPSAVPPPLAAIVYRCLEKAPDSRYQSARELSEALAAGWAGPSVYQADLRGLVAQAAAASPLDLDDDPIFTTSVAPGPLTPIMVPGVSAPTAAAPWSPAAAPPPPPPPPPPPAPAPQREREPDPVPDPAGEPAVAAVDAGAPEASPPEPAVIAAEPSVAASNGSAPGEFPNLDPAQTVPNARRPSSASPVAPGGPTAEPAAAPPGPASAYSPGPAPPPPPPFAGSPPPTAAAAGAPPAAQWHDPDARQTAAGVDARPRLVQLSGAEPGGALPSIPLGDVTRIGRGGENEVTVRDSLVSRYHLRLSREGADFFVEDLNTPNGTLHNGQRLRSRARLTPGDLIQIGTTVFQFQR